MIKHIPRGVAIQEDSSWEYTEAVGVRMTPDDPAAVLELSQDMTIGGYDEPVEQCIGLSHGQMITLRDVLTTEINKALMKQYVAITGSSCQGDMYMSMFRQPVYNRESLVDGIRLMVSTRVADDELTDENICDNLDTDGELTINLYDGDGETMYSIFEV